MKKTILYMSATLVNFFFSSLPTSFSELEPSSPSDLKSTSMGNCLENAQSDFSSKSNIGMGISE